MKGFFRLRLTTVEGEPLGDRIIYTRFRRSKDDRIIRQARDFDFRGDARFDLPAYPEVAFYYLDANPSRYRPFKSSFFSIDAETEQENDPSPLTLYRQPDKWIPDFARWSDLGDRFTRLKTVLERSPGIWIRGGRTFPDPLIGDRYDNVLDRTAEIRAKTALLNLFSRMTELVVPGEGNKNWFSFVEQILVMTRERFVAFAAPGLYDAVERIRENAIPDYKSADSGQHHGNFPAEYEARDLISVKSTHDRAGLQVTVARGRGGLLMDVDLDENGDLLRHFGDILRHFFTGGTDPIDIREYLVQQQPDRDLGYGLRAV